MINELVKEDYIGYDLKVSILKLINEIQDKMEIPSFMTWANITSLYKKKGSRESMDNQRGIFGLSIFKKILQNLLFANFYEDIDRNMTDSNIGGRSKRMAKDHLFVLYGIMNSVVHGKEDPIEIQVYDIEKAFDKLWLEDAMNDLYDTIPKEKRNNNISLI